MNRTGPSPHRYFLRFTSDGHITLGADFDGPPAGARPGADAGGRPDPAPDGDPDAADILVQKLLDWGVTHVFGIHRAAGPLIAAVRKRRAQITYVAVRHDEAAATMAVGFAKYSGRLGACIATTGAGAIRLLTGLCDAAAERAPAIVITCAGHEPAGHAVDTVHLMQPVALYNERITMPAQVDTAGDQACRAALDGRGIAHLAVPAAVLALKPGQGVPPGPQGGPAPLRGTQPPATPPPAHRLQAAAGLLNAGRRVAIVAGQGCAAALGELERLADTLAAPVVAPHSAKPLPFGAPKPATGDGVRASPSDWVLASCDTVVVLGCVEPCSDDQRIPSQARILQVDPAGTPASLGLPIEVGLTGDIKATLHALHPLLVPKANCTFLAEAQRRWHAARDLMMVASACSPLRRPLAAMRALSDLAPPDALFSVEWGTVAGYAARTLDIRDGRSFTGAETSCGLGGGLPLAIAAAFAHPDRPSIGIAGQAGFAPLMAELSTAVAGRLNVKLMVLDDGALASGEAGPGRAGSGPEVGPAGIDVAAIAEALGARGFRLSGAADPYRIVKAWLASTGPAVLDVQTNAGEGLGGI